MTTAGSKGTKARRGAGRVRAASRDGMTVTTVALADDVLRRLAIMAAERRTVMTELVRQAVDQWLARHDRRRAKEGKS